MQYAPTLTDQKIDSILSIESPARYALGRMQYAPIHTDQKFDSLLSIESPVRYTLGRMQYTPTLTDQKINSLLSIESPARYVLGRMQYAPTLTDQKLDSLLSIKSPARYVSIKYVLIESYTCQKWDYPLKPPTRKDLFFVYRCRGVWHTPHKRPRQGTNKSIHHPFFWIHVIHWIKNPVHFGSYAILPYPDGSKIRFPIKTTYP